MDKRLDGELGNLAIAVETGTRNVVRDSDHVSGIWIDEPVIWPKEGSSRAIALEVLNPFLGSTRLADAAVDFTRRFGPLTLPFRRGESFRFSIDEWKRARQHLSVVWRAARGGSKPKWPFTVSVDGNEGDHFSFANGQILFRTRNLLTFMSLEIASVPAENFRTCANFGYGCKSPYFFSGDLRETHCSEACAVESRKRSKREWWNSNRKGVSDGTQKAR